MESEGGGGGGLVIELNVDDNINTETRTINFIITEKKNEELLRENISCSCLRFLPNGYVFYDISLGHKQKHEFVLVSIGRKVPQSAFCAWVYSCSDTIKID